MASILSRRNVLLGSAFGLVVGSAWTSAIAAGRYLPEIIRNLPSLNPGGSVTVASIENDFAVGLLNAIAAESVMQTNGVVLRLDTRLPPRTLNPAAITLEVVDRGHNADGRVIDQPRTIGVRRTLVGPAGREAIYDANACRLLLVLTEPLYNQNVEWRTTIIRLRLDAGWLAGASAEVIEGASVIRNDSLPYPPFPIKPVTLPFERLSPHAPLAFEVTGMSDFARDGGSFARVEAWAAVAGVNGPITSASTMTASRLAPGDGSPSGVPAPVYRLQLQSVPYLPEGPGEIQYSVYPFIGPPWLSTQSGEDFPTQSTPRGVPFCHDRSNSWAPLYGAVAQNGVGLSGNDVSGLSTSIAGAISAARPYRDCASVAAAVRLINRSTAPSTIADGPIRRVLPHDDIAGGVAILPEVSGSIAGSNFGAYNLRTSMTSRASFPPGATAFEIRSPSGLPTDAVRIRGVDSAGNAVTAKGLPNRVLLRGLWLDGTGTSGAGNTIFDCGSGGLPATRPAADAAFCQLSIDCVITENTGAGSGSPPRYRFGYLWDVRMRHEGATGTLALGVVGGFSGYILSAGSSYSAIVPRFMVPLTLVGARLTNVGIRDSGGTLLFGRLILGVCFDFTVATNSPIITLGSSVPSRGGLGIGNVFCEADIAPSGPAVQIGADGAYQPIDNVIIRHLGSHMRVGGDGGGGRVNLLYQDQGYVRIDKFGSIAYSAVRAYTTKGDLFPAPETPNRVSRAWEEGASYQAGQIVHLSASGRETDTLFYQAQQRASSGDLITAPLTDSSAWLRAGLVSNRAFGQQPLRQGNTWLRYHIGSRGNVAASTYNGVPPGLFSGYGLAWGADELTDAKYDDFYVDTFTRNYLPNPSGPLAARVAAGRACLPFDIVGTVRRNDGTGAAGAYEVAARSPVKRVLWSSSSSEEI